ncbi:aminopeptidase N [Coxiella endosymbiont of Amblyomma nuttalli]|uniref:aminopeptidase N n=1 Tax=Coxiella endosymbiont of Amblyomma nuttalli TaxID=2749996 RepID=UPI001BA53BE2|nr:aminopeptidase N [Coxiella endosymbiont of Amblyomma nuttalli]QTS84033.1 Aminopeptidase N [Coxiella endosymbiont of Amblyomma nuttalli]
MHERKSQPVYLKDYRPPNFLIDTVHLYVDLFEEETYVRAVLNVRRNPASTRIEAPLTLDGEDIILKSLAINGYELPPSDYMIDRFSLTIPIVPNQFVLDTKVVIKPQENTQLNGLYKSRGNFCTQCEAEGFRRITYFLDRPDVMAKYTTTITADRIKYPYLLSNGNLIETKILNHKRHRACWQDPSKKSSYLFALVAGDFDVLKDNFITCSGRKVALQLYLEKGFKDQGMFALTALKKSMRWDEEKFGREYDLDIYNMVAVSDFNMGAMENKGLNIFNTKNILANAKTATDDDYIRIEEVIGHEYFHNWSGNRVTCRDWFQITLKEGLTMFREQAFSEDVTSKSVSRINVVKILRDVQFLEDASSMAHSIRPRSYIEINNFYTATVYNKGAEVIRMLQTLLGSGTFRKAMDLYFSLYDGQAVTTEDFIQAMEDASGKHLEQFKRWYDQSGTPVLEINSEYHAKDKTLTLIVKQTCLPTPDQSKKLPFHLPLSLGFVGPACGDMPTQLEGENKAMTSTRVLEIKKSETVFRFINVKHKPILSLLRHFSAPVQLNYPYTDEELLYLLQYDIDPFARWEAEQLFAKRLIFKLMDDYHEKKPLKMDDRFVKIFQEIIEWSHKDPWYAATLLLLPSESYLMQCIKKMDIEALFTSRQFVKKALATVLVDDLKSIYRSHQSVCYKYHYTDVGKRALKNRCLNYLTETNDKLYYQLAYEQFKNSDNMTDTIGAFSALINHDCEERDQILKEFYQKWKEQPLIVNKWLSLQASSTLPSTFETVRKLTQHPAFNIKNPNNVYSLLAVFSANVIRFHDTNGEGYRLIADYVLKIDSMNPQVAARILQPLTRWQIMDEKHQTLMKAEITRISQARRLSTNVYEIVTKSLAT